MSVGVFGAEVDEGGARVDRTTRERCCFSPSLFRPLSFSVVLSPLFLSLRHSSLSPPSFACSVYLLSFSLSLSLVHARFVPSVRGFTSAAGPQPRWRAVRSPSWIPRRVYLSLSLSLFAPVQGENPFRPANPAVHSEDLPFLRAPSARGIPRATLSAAQKALERVSRSPRANVGARVARSRAAIDHRWIMPTTTTTTTTT